MRSSVQFYRTSIAHTEDEISWIMWKDILLHISCIFSCWVTCGKTLDGETYACCFSIIYKSFPGWIYNLLIPSYDKANFSSKWRFYFVTTKVSTSKDLPHTEVHQLITAELNNIIYLAVTLSNNLWCTDSELWKQHQWCGWVTTLT